MGANLAELIDTGEKRDGRGRRLITAPQREELLRAYAASGLTQRAFARQEGVNYHTLVEWLQRQREKGGGKSVPHFRELSLGAVIARPALLEVTLAGGLIVRGENAAAVAELVRALQPSAN